MKKTLLIILLACLTANCDKGNTSDIPIDPLKAFAIRYEPCPEKAEECFDFFWLPYIPEDVTKVLNERVIDDQFIVYNTLIMLKLYRTQMEWAHQSYDIRNETNKRNPILRAFANYSGMSLSGEFVSSNISYSWIKGQNKYSAMPLIREEIKRIDSVIENIEKGVYWEQSES